jgi:hypothetical protein
MEITSIYSLMRGGSEHSRGGPGRDGKRVEEEEAEELRGDVDKWEMTNFPLLPLKGKQDEN